MNIIFHNFYSLFYNTSILFYIISIKFAYKVFGLFNNSFFQKFDSNKLFEFFNLLIFLLILISFNPASYYSHISLVPILPKRIYLLLYFPSISS